MGRRKDAGWNVPVDGLLCVPVVVPEDLALMSALAAHECATSDGLPLRQWCDRSW